jgi:hypothetical protein
LQTSTINWNEGVSGLCPSASLLYEERDTDRGKFGKLTDDTIQHPSRDDLCLIDQTNQYLPQVSNNTLAHVGSDISLTPRIP